MYLLPQRQNESIFYNKAKYNPLAGTTFCGTFNLEIAGETFKFFYGGH